ncbi:MAG: zinc metalloprotease [Bacteroidota bacterium]|nr:zinc metalloprotease [Bacteroidota bacterium]
MFFSRKSLVPIGLLSAFVLFNACKKDLSSLDQPDVSTPPTAATEPTGRVCGAEEALHMQLAADPSLRERMLQIERFTQRTIAMRAGTTSGGTTTTTAMPATVTIPVVVNVLYNTAAENISDAQIQSQIDVLNEDFNRTNADAANTPSMFQSQAASIGIKFTLNAIVRKSTTTTSWTNNNAMKSTKTGGIAPTNPTTMLNIWVCNLGGGMLGYAQYPGGSSTTDGVVILYSAFGRTGTLMSRYNKGRTATHEVGHWMNLRHIWGDAACGDDLVADTPQQDGASAGMPAFPSYSTCAGNPAEMTMDYMDYTDDAGLNMFTVGQKDRARACFASGGPRYAYYVK